ncbi:hypothetical protein Q7409_04850 [Glaesserella parasuis]|nr:hypothetical protein [Glaesserella parasuis]MDO9975317.1 hypothetical protein [Glaesserella parasuis]MDP0041161.1 hypothetical protein [Glaesserella parasuis]
MNIDAESLIYDLKDQVYALEALDQLLCVSSHHKEQIDNSGIAKLIRAITHTTSQKLEELESLLNKGRE